MLPTAESTARGNKNAAMAEVSSCLFNVQNEKFCAALSDDDASGFILHIMSIPCNKQTSWKGNISQDVLSKFASQCHMEEEEYRTLLIQAFSEGQNKEFEYDFKTASHELVIKKDMEDHGIKMKFGTFKLEKQLTCAAIQSYLLDTLVHDQASSRKRIHELEESERKLKQENERLVRQIEECVNIKEKVEAELYAKFIAILNEKKKRIRELSKGRSKEGNEKPSSMSNAKNFDSIEEDSIEDEDYGEDTDYETDDERATGKKRVLVKR